jgi:uncharacterized alpha-E superfamily protein
MQQALVGIGATASRSEALAAAADLARTLEKSDAATLFQRGLHEFLGDALARLSRLHEALVAEYFEARLGDAA